MSADGYNEQANMYMTQIVAMIEKRLRDSPHVTLNSIEAQHILRLATNALYSMRASVILRE